jgi:hypothetical protein
LCGSSYPLTFFSQTLTIFLSSSFSHSCCTGGGGIRLAVVEAGIGGGAPNFSRRLVLAGSGAARWSGIGGAGGPHARPPPWRRRWSGIGGAAMAVGMEPLAARKWPGQGVLTRALLLGVAALVFRLLTGPSLPWTVGRRSTRPCPPPSWSGGGPTSRLLAALYYVMI